MKEMPSRYSEVLMTSYLCVCVCLFEIQLLVNKDNSTALYSSTGVDLYGSQTACSHSVWGSTFMAHDDCWFSAQTY